MSGQLQLPIGSGTPEPVARKSVGLHGETGSEPVPEPIRTRSRSAGGHAACPKPVPDGSGPVPEPIATDASSTGIPEQNQTVQTGSGITPSSKGEKTSGTDHHAVPLTRGEERSLTLLPSPGVTGERGPEPASLPAEAVLASGTGSDRLKSQRSASGTDRAPTLRPYQAEAIAAIEREHGDGKRSTLLVLPTGTGKTVVFAELARREVSREGRVLVLAHRTELLEQAAAKLRAAGVDCAIEQGERHAGSAAAVIASVQTLRGARLASWPEDAFSLVVVDEAHHATASSYSAILARFARAKVLGVTATPDRADGEALGQAFTSCAYHYELRQAIRDGWLASLRARRVVVDGVDLADVHTRAGDLDAGELAAVMGDAAALHGVAQPLRALAAGRRTVLFAVNVEHARALAEVLCGYQPGIARAVDGSATPAERAEVLAAFRGGEFQILVNVALYTEGFDEPSVACVAIARPTKSRALYVQMIGRGTRLAEGKRDCLVLDFTGMAGRHRLVGPADALAGTDLADDVRKKVEAALADGQLELDAVLEAAERDAEAEAKQRRARLHTAALTHYRAREIDLFLGEVWPGFDPDSPAAQRPATAEQLAAIAAAKLGNPPPGLSEAEARAMLDAVVARRKAGLCTIPQARLLERLGCDTKGMTFARAQELISAVAGANAWKSSWRVLQGQREYQPSRRRA